MNRKDIRQWIYVHNQEPAPNKEVIALSPEGVTHLTTWRPAYNIFCCQCKQESSRKWRWAYLPTSTKEESWYTPENTH